MSSAQAGCVYLVGAGPGEIDLLTLRAHALIESASCVLHDDLVSAEVLSLAAPGAQVRNVGKRCGPKTITQGQINNWMIAFARSGESVVRLKSGDPLLFGRAAEEIQALEEAGVAFEIVPGVSAGFAAAALARHPLTGRVTHSRVLFATRHLAADSPVAPAGGLAGIAPEATLVLYMPGRNYRAIQTELEANGWPPETRCILASCAGTPSQTILSCSLRELPAQPSLPAPVVMIFSAPESPPIPSRQTPVA